MVLGLCTQTSCLHSATRSLWKYFPPMTLVRRGTTVLSTTAHTVAMGGYGGRPEEDHVERLNNIEVLNIHTKQWSIASPLPYEIQQATVTLCGDTLYMMGGLTDVNDFSVVSCRLNDLLAPTKTRYSNIWLDVPDLPVRMSACATVHGCVLAIGGEVEKQEDTNKIYRYTMKPQRSGLS